MLRRLLYKLTARLPCRLIKIDGRPYLERYYLGKALGLTFYLHRFVAPDDERNVHDHPWGRSAALVLVGGYLEERLRWFDLASGGWRAKARRMFPGRVNVINGWTFHRITAPRPETWTLFAHTRRCKSWGFLYPAEEAVVYYQPFDIAANATWWERAPMGAEAGREAYGDAQIAREGA